MKTLSITIILMSLSLLSFSQMAVVDGPLLGYLKGTDIAKDQQSKAQFLKQYNELQQQGKLLKEQHKIVTDVNSAIRNGIQVRNIIDKQQHLIKLTLDGIDMIAKSNLAPETKDKGIGNLLDDRESSKELFQLVKDVLTPNKLKMNDAERLDYLDTLESKIDKYISKISSYNKKMNRIIEVYDYYDN